MVSIQAILLYTRTSDGDGAIMDTIDFPLATKYPEKYMANEAELCAYMLEQHDWWRKMGCYTPERWQRGTTPDFLAAIRPIRRREAASKPARSYSDFLRVEAEYHSVNFKAHGHEPANVHLIFTYTAWWPTRKVMGVDTVACYRKCDDGWYRWSLDDDIGVLFHKRPSQLFGRTLIPNCEDDTDE